MSDPLLPGQAEIDLINNTSAPAQNIYEPLGCRNWFGELAIHGFSKMDFDGKSVLAHEIMFEANGGVVGNDEVVDHFVCDNSACVNADHLRAVLPVEDLT